MKKNTYTLFSRWLIFIWGLSLTQPTQAQTVPPPVIQWQRVLGDPGTAPVQIIKAFNGGYGLVYGNTVLRLSESGSIAWTIKLPDLVSEFGIRYDNFASAIAALPDGGFMVLARSERKWSLVRLDEAGNGLWVKPFADFTPSNSLVRSFLNGLVRTNDGGFIAYGSTQNGRDGTSTNLYRFDADGNLTLLRALFFNDGSIRPSSSPGQVIQTQDGGYLVLGGSSNSAVPRVEGWAAKLDNQLNVVQQQRYDYLRFFTDVIPSPYGSEGVIGVGYNGDQTGTNTLFVNPNGSGDNTSGTYRPSVVGTIKFIVSGSNSSHEVGDVVSQNGGDIRLVSFSVFNETRWMKTLGGSGAETIRDLITTGDGGYLIVGTTSSTDGDVQGKSDNSESVWIIKLGQPAPGGQLAVAQSIPNQTGTVGQYFNLAIPAGTFSGPVANVDVSDLPRGLMYVNRTIMGTPEATDQRTVTVTATDGQGNSVKTTFVLAFTTTNPATAPKPPILVQPIPNQTYNVGHIPFLALGGYFYDPTEPGTARYRSGWKITASGLPDGLYFEVNDAANETVRTPSIAFVRDTPTRVGTYMVTIRATTSGFPDQPVVATFTITVIDPAVSTGPLAVAQPIFNQTGTIGQPFSFRIPDATFSGPVTAVDVSDLPRGLMYVNRTIMGTVQAADQRTLFVIAYDGKGNSVGTAFMLTFGTGSSQPSTGQLAVAQPIPNQTGTVGQSFSFRIPDNAFSGPVANVDVSDLPRGLMYVNRTIMGRAETADQRTLTVTAFDSQGNSVKTTFVLTFVNGGRLAARPSPERSATLQAGVYPNPVDDQMRVQIEGVNDQSVRLWLVDLRGHTVFDKQVLVNSTQHEEVINVARQSAGNYVLRVSAGQQAKSLKVLKQ